MEGLQDSPKSLNESAMEPAWNSSLPASLEPCGPGYPGVAGFENYLPNLPAKLAFQFLFGSTPMQELPGFRDRVFLQNRS